MSPSDKLIEESLDAAFLNLQVDPEFKKINEDMQCVRRVLDWIDEDRKDGFNVSTEIIYWALKFMKEDPTISIGEAIMMGFAEWDK